MLLKMLKTYNVVKVYAGSRCRWTLVTNNVLWYSEFPHLPLVDLMSWRLNENRLRLLLLLLIIMAKKIMRACTFIGNRR